MSFKVVGKTWVYVSNCGISCSSNFWHCWFSNWNWDNFFNRWNSYKFEDNLDKIFFVNKNQSNNLSVGCRLAFSLIELIEVDATLEKKIEQYEGEFGQDEFLDL